MKNIVFTILFTVLALGQTQAQKLIDKKGTASFFSEAPLENIEALNEEVLGAIDLEKGTLAVSMYIRGFHFEKSLMEEHFNENYMESGQFPKATFTGAILNFNDYDISKPGTYQTEVEGTIEIHGVKKPLKTPVEFAVSKDAIQANTVFTLKVAEFDIEVPKIVIKNIAEEVEVKSNFNFSR